MWYLAPVLGFLILGCSSAAAAPDTWVSGTGVDAGNCNAAAPCRTLQYALSRTTAGGIIAVASSGSFAGVNINKSVTITADGITAVLRTPATCGAVICINMDSGLVTLRGLIIDPMGGGNGITIRNIGTFHLKDSVVRQSRIGLLSTSRGSGFQSILNISNSIISRNAVGIKVVSNGASRIALDRVRVHSNAKGILLDDSGRAGTITAAVIDSVIAGHSDYGLYAVTTGFGPVPSVSATLDRTAVLDNGQGIRASGEFARVRIGDSTITGNAVALRSINNGAIPSYGTNKLDGNGAGESPTVTIPHQ